MLLDCSFNGHNNHNKHQKMKMLLVYSLFLLVLTPGFARVLKNDREIDSSLDSRDDHFSRTINVLNSFDGDDRLKVNCDSVTRMCQVTLKFNKNHHEYFELDVEKASLMSEMFQMKRKPVENVRLHYSHPGLGDVKTDEPLMHFAVKPESDDDIGTKFILEQTTKCFNSTDKRCVNKYPLDYNSIWNISDSLAYCQVLTSPIHGYNAGPDEVLNAAFSMYHFQYYDSSCNLVVDWTKGAAFKINHPYSSAAANVITVGRQLGLLLHNMIVLKKVEASNIHLVGHSLGAHVAHYASIWLRNLSLSYPHKSDSTDWIPGRITGLDPAAPQFQGHPGTHLVKEDAAFVDVIHTAAIGPGSEVYNLLRGRLGMSQLVGSVDFFPNGGTTPQPACAKEIAISRFFSFPCSHIEALTYFKLSLFSDGRAHTKDEMIYPSHSCNSTLQIEAANDTSVDRVTDDPVNTGSMGMQAINFKGRGRQCLTT